MSRHPRRSNGSLQQILGKLQSRRRDRWGGGRQAPNCGIAALVLWSRAVDRSARLANSGLVFECARGCGVASRSPARSRRRCSRSRFRLPERSPRSARPGASRLQAAAVARRVRRGSLAVSGLGSARCLSESERWGASVARCPRTAGIRFCCPWPHLAFVLVIQSGGPRYAASASASLSWHCGFETVLRPFGRQNSAFQTRRSGSARQDRPQAIGVEPP